VIVSVTLTALVAFVLVGLGAQGGLRGSSFTPFFSDAGAPVGSFLNAAALMFVAYTGYGRIATLGEEVRAPRRTIPRAIVITLAVSALLYTTVATVAVSALGSAELAASTGGGAAPLEVAAQRLDLPGLAVVLAIGAVTAMVGVLLNLLLGLSRVVLAMARRGDLPGYFRRVHARTGSPRRAVFLVGGVVIVLVAIGDVRITWSFSAFTVLVYYALTNLAALFVPAEGRLFPRWIAAAGLIGCLSLAAFVPPLIIAVGTGILLFATLCFFLLQGIRARRRG
jgi:APA family basic amino acid/polyamine antiporter